MLQSSLEDSLCIHEKVCIELGGGGGTDLTTVIILSYKAVNQQKDLNYPLILIFHV
jgi:hypothetical protein